jgi:hypothetical protein
LVFEIFICKFQIGKLKSKNLFFLVCTLQGEIYRQINDIRDTGPDTENTDNCPDVAMSLYGPLVNQSEYSILKSHIIISFIVQTLEM